MAKHYEWITGVAVEKGTFCSFEMPLPLPESTVEQYLSELLLANVYSAKKLKTMLVSGIDLELRALATGSVRAQKAAVSGVLSERAVYKLCAKYGNEFSVYLAASESKEFPVWEAFAKTKLTNVDASTLGDMDKAAAITCGKDYRAAKARSLGRIPTEESTTEEPASLTNYSDDDL